MSITIKGLAELAATLKGDPVTFAVQDGMHDLGVKLVELTRQNTPMWTGALRASIMFKMSTTSAAPTFVHVGSSLHYAPYVEFGGRPHWPPRAALQPWADAHGIPVFLVQRSIALKGTPAIHMFKRAVEDNWGQLQTIIDKITKDIELRFT